MLLLWIIVPILALVLLLVHVLFSVHKPYGEKVSIYECGFVPITDQTRAPFSIQYYLVAIIFLVFDLEIALFYPIAVSLYNVGFYGITTALFFFILLTLGFIYELGTGAIHFTSQRSNLSLLN